MGAVPEDKVEKYAKMRAALSKERSELLSETDMIVQ